MGAKLNSNFSRGKKEARSEPQSHTSVLEILKKLNTESKRKVFFADFCKDLKNKLSQKYKKTISPNISKEQSNVDENFNDIPEQEKNHVNMEFKVNKIEEIKHYIYGFPGAAKISALEHYTKQISTKDMFTITLNDHEIHINVHRNLLTLNSEYLAANLPFELSTLTIRGYNLEAVYATLLCLYTHTLYLTLNTVDDIFRFCYELKITAILHFLTNIFENSDPLYILNELRKLIANYKNCSRRQYIRMLYDVHRNYSNVLKHAAIIDLTFEEIKEVVKEQREIRSHLMLEERCELDIFYAITDWILHDRKSRMIVCLDLLPNVRFEKMTVEQLKKAFNPQLLMCFPENLRNLMFKIHDHIVNDNRSLRVFDTYSTLPKIEKALNENNIEKTGRTLKIAVKSADVEENRLEQHGCMRNEKEEEESENIIKEAVKSFKNIVSHQILHDLRPEGNNLLDKRSLILLLGGFQSQVAYKAEQGLSMHHLEQLNEYDDKSDTPQLNTSDFTWSPLSQRLPKNLAHFQSLKIGSVVFTIGGIDVSILLYEKSLSPVNDCYAYSITNDGWYKTTPMHYPRGYHGAVRINDKIFVFGGITVENKKVILTNKCEEFDIRKNSWTEVCAESVRPLPRAAFGMVYYRDKVWVIGGLSKISEKNYYQSKELLSDVWVYSVQDKEWTSVEIPQLPKPRAFMTTVTFRNEIFVIGGHEVEQKTESGQRTTRDLRTNSVIILRDLTNVWEKGPSLNWPRIYSTATVFRDVLCVVGGATHSHKHIDEPILCSFSGSYELYNPDINPNWVDHAMVFSLYGGSAVTIQSNFLKPHVGQK